MIKQLFEECDWTCRLTPGALHTTVEFYIVIDHEHNVPFEKVGVVN